MCAAICSWRVLTKVTLLPSSAVSTAMLVWPHRPNRYSTPRRSRSRTSCLEISSFMAVPGWLGGWRAFAIQRPGRGTVVGVGDAGRHRPLDAAALLLLLPGVRQDADRAGQDEEAAAQLGREPELGVDDGGGAVDVHGDGCALARCERVLDQRSRLLVVAADDALLARVAHQLHQAHGARVDAVEAVAEAGDDLAVRGDEGVELGLDI